MWVRLTDDWYENGKFQRVSCLAELLYIRCLTWSARNLTDGFVPYATVARLAPEDVGDQMTQGTLNDVQYARAVLADELVDVGLWKEEKKNRGFVVHDYLDFNKSKEKILEERRRHAARQTARNADATRAQSTRIADAN